MSAHSTHFAYFECRRRFNACRVNVGFKMDIHKYVHVHCWKSNNGRNFIGDVYASHAYRCLMMVEAWDSNQYYIHIHECFINTQSGFVHNYNCTVCVFVLFVFASVLFILISTNQDCFFLPFYPDL